MLGDNYPDTGGRLADNLNAYGIKRKPGAHRYLLANFFTWMNTSETAD